MPSKLDDNEIIDLIIETQGDSYVEELYKRYSEKIYRKCLSFVKDVTLAEDLTHDIFLKILLNLSKFKKKSKFSTWIYSITYNYCIDFLRKSRKENYVTIDEERSLVGDMVYEEDSNLIEIETSRMIRMLDMIRGDEKMILVMKYHDGMSIREIQQILNVSESAVKMRIKRAKEKLRQLYNEIYKDD